MKTLHSFGELARALERGTVAALVSSEIALRGAATLIQKDAQQRIGEYQGSVGPFQSWAELADFTKEDRLRLGYSENDPLLRSGELRESIEVEAYPHVAVVGSKMKIAAYQEFGTDRIPPRPFLGPAAFSNKARIHRLIGRTTVAGLVSGHAIHSLLGYEMDTTS